MSNRYPPEPGSDDCSLNRRLMWNGEETLATWYPQMGGYTGKAVVVGSKDGGCVNVYVWHDGEFPFSEDGREPHVIHHCMMSQFRSFADAVEEYNGKESEE